MITILSHLRQRFASLLGGQFATEWGGQFHRNIHVRTKSELKKETIDIKKYKEAQKVRARKYITKYCKDAITNYQCYINPDTAVIKEGLTHDALDQSKGLSTFLSNAVSLGYEDSEDVFRFLNTAFENHLKRARNLNEHDFAKAMRQMAHISNVIRGSFQYHRYLMDAYNDYEEIYFGIKNIVDED